VRPKRRRLHPFVRRQASIINRSKNFCLGLSLARLVPGFTGANLPGILVDFRALARR
jgi:hypothetical protein